MTSLIPSLTLWMMVTIGVALKANSRDAGLHRKAKGLNFLCAAFLVLSHCSAFRMLGWAFRNSGEILPAFYVAHDLFAPWATFSVWVLNTILSVVALLLGLGLARRKERARVVFLGVFPLLAIIDWLEAFKGAMAQPRSSGTYVLIGAAIALVTVVPYAGMALFYRRESRVSPIFAAG
jgi:hypothetical protein